MVWECASDIVPSLPHEPMQVCRERCVFAMVHCQDEFLISTVVAPDEPYGMSLIEALGGPQHRPRRRLPKDKRFCCRSKVTVWHTIPCIAAARSWHPLRNIGIF